MKESTIERQFVRACRERGALSYKFVSPSHRGVPDRVVITSDGRVVFVELKTPRGRLSGLQKYEIARLRERGVSVWVVHGLDAALSAARVICGLRPASVPPRRAKCSKSCSEGVRT